MIYLHELACELDRVGVRGSLRRRILIEFEDHLTSDPAAELGAPAEIARQFADELGTRRATRAAAVSFGALAMAGAPFAIALLASGSAGFNSPRLHVDSALLGAVAVLLSVIGPQVAFAAGTLAALRAFWHRRDRVLPRADAVIIGRRAAVATTSGLAAMGGMALLVVEFNHGLAGWWTTLVLSGAGLGAATLLAAAPALVSAARLRPAAEGAAGDLFDDLGPLTPGSLRGRPWKFALTFAAGVALAITAAGVVQSDGFDGALRGLADGAACLTGFGLLGRYLGLR